MERCFETPRRHPPPWRKTPPLAEAVAALDTPIELQKPKAEKGLTLVNFQTPQQRLIDPMAVPRDANFLYERQRANRHGKRSLPDWLQKNHRNPSRLISHFAVGAD
jgi:hypothetical protein